VKDPEATFAALRRSRFRSRFHLGDQETRYLQRKGPVAVLREARQFIHSRLSPAHPANDGKQTPVRNHPAFIAQHATATCCRGCLERWHGIPRGRELREEEEDYIIDIIARWLTSSLSRREPPPRQDASLFDG
jgi:hypothetical protein